MCNCVKLCNDQLRKDNAALDTRFAFDAKAKTIRSVLFIPTVRLDPKIRKPLPTLAITYCPICGEKQIDDEGKPVRGKRKAKAKQ